MEATVVKIGASFGFKVPESVIKNFNLTLGSKIEMNVMQDGEFVFRKKSNVRKGWNAAFAQYAMEGEDNHLLPDFLDSETDLLL